MSVDDMEELKERLLRIASECVAKGPSYAQEGVVLRMARSELHPQSLPEEQSILEAWHRLFADGDLDWGYNLDNPSPPFFHSSPQNAVRVVGAR